jgi:ABC-2 type transport system permease protein
MSSFLFLVQAEVRREFQRARAYWLEVLADQILFTLGFLLLSGLFQLVAGGSYAKEAALASLVGFVTWRVADGCILRTTRSISDDAQAGTLEQVWLSAVSPRLVFLSRSVAILLYHSVRGFLLAIILVFLLGLPLIFPVGLLLVFILTQAGAFGVAFIIAGLHLIYKNVSSIGLALSTALLFLTGALAPLDNAPLLYRLSRALPLTIGIDLSRQVIAGKLQISAVLRQPDFYWLLVNTAVYVLLGLAIWEWGQRTARRDGSLAHY